MEDRALKNGAVVFLRLRQIYTTAINMSSRLNLNKGISMTKKKGLTTKHKLLSIAICCTLYGNTLAQDAERDLGDTEYDSPPEMAIVEEIVVWGMRAAQSKAIMIKRESANFVDSIVAEDIGRMPDTTITDSLQRVPGVQIAREANEGTSLNVRGMPQVLTTLNGEQFLSPWTITGVGANYTDIPAGMIGGADVFKSASANQLAGGISGLIDLKTLNPTELKNGWTVKAKLEVSEGSLKPDHASGIDNDMSVYVGHNGKHFSFIAGAFSSYTNSANYQMKAEQRLAFLDEPGGTPGDPLDLNGDGDLVNDWYIVPSEFGASANFMERERSGLTLGANAILNKNWNLRGDIFYTNMDQQDLGIGAYFKGYSSVNAYGVNNEDALEEHELFNVLQAGTQVGSSNTINYTDKNGNSQTRTLNSVIYADLLSPELQSVSTNDINRTGALNTNIQLDYSNQENLSASFRIVHSLAERENRNAEMGQGTPAWYYVDEDGIAGKDALDGYSVQVNYTKDVPQFYIADDISSADLLKKYQASANGADTDATLSVLRADLNYSFGDDAFITSIDGGIRFGMREAEKSQILYVTPTARYSSWDDPRVPSDKRYLLRSGNEVWEVIPDYRDFVYENEPEGLLTVGGLQDNGFGIENTITYDEFGPIKGFENGVSAIAPTAWEEPLAFMNSLYPGTKTINDPGASYKVKENSASLYTQLNFGVDVGFPIEGNFGLRVINTQRSVDQAVVPALLDKFNSIGYLEYNKVPFVSEINTDKHSFTDVLPSLNISFLPSDDWIIRLAAAKTVARNDLENVGSGLNLNYQSCIKTDENGDAVTVTDGDGNIVAENVTCVRDGSERGNTEIKPWRASVFNTGAEWYFADFSMLSFGLFLINVESSVEQFQEQRSFLDADGIDRGHLANIWTTANAGASDLSGFEFGYRQQFAFLPSFLSYTGIEFNYTYSDSESADTDVHGDPLPLPSNSKHQSNLILWYEEDAISVRLAHNWRSEEYIERVELVSNEVPLSLGNWQESTGYLDLSMGYWLNDNVSLFVNITNLTEQDRRTYSQYSDQFNSLWVQERRLAAGVTISM
ncbi:TonB-dependent receptor [Alteromonadaceae bacterium Bs31]|nr:TonB-dependent receptor [Alteromonadaceae bacterium Bs31]